jgi:mitochondrial fission protein ELM1
MKNSAKIASDTTWTITDGKAGMVSQALGLAEAVGLPVIEKTIRPAAPWKWLPPGTWPAGASGAGRGSDPLVAPLPRLVISCGRHSIRPAFWVKNQSEGRTFAVHIQHPRINPARFDLVVAPEHDRLTGPNVIPIRGSLHRVNRQRLDAAAARIAPSLADLPRPLVAVLIGGTNSVYTLTDRVVARLADDLSALCKQSGAGLMVTPSRRTGKVAERQLRERLAGEPAVMWDGTGENPYLGYLGLADAIVVTCDSVNMVSEACATGKPVYIVELEGRKHSKFRDFREMLTTMGIVRRFDGVLDRWSYDPLDETARIAKEIRLRMGLSP